MFLSYFFQNAPDAPAPIGCQLGHRVISLVQPLLEGEHKVAGDLHPVSLDPVDAAVAGRHQVELGEVVQVDVAEISVAAAEPG